MGLTVPLIIKTVKKLLGSKYVKCIIGIFDFVAKINNINKIFT